MPTLRISFAGLCTFIFDPPLRDAASGPRKAKVLLQRLTRARALSNKVNLQNEVLDQHFPLLEFNLADLSPASTRRADFHCFPDASGKMTRGVCLLNGEDLKIRIDGRELGAQGLTLSTHEPANPRAPKLSPEDQATLWWLARLEDAFPDRHPIDPRLLETPPGSNQPILARVVDLQEGVLKTSGLTDLPMTVAHGNPAFNRRVATSLEFETHFRSSVEIEIETRRNGRIARSRLVLAPAGGADLRIGIMNMEIDRFIGMDPAQGPRPEADFEVFADLLEPSAADSPGRTAPRPFLRQSTPGNPAGAGMSNCVPSGN